MLHLGFEVVASQHQRRIILSEKVWLLPDNLLPAPSRPEMEIALTNAALSHASLEKWSGICKSLQRLTNVYLVVNDSKQVLLGMKKRGFGQGKFNGFGGKLDVGETPEQCAFREMKEECGLNVLDLDLRGVLLYDYPSKPDRAMQVYVFRALNYTGQVVETEEMAPQWFAFDQVNYGEMWADDPYWMSKILNTSTSKRFVGWFTFSQDMTQVEECSVKEVDL